MAYVLDRDLVPVRIGSPGDLWIGGLGVARGTWEAPNCSAEAFRPDPFDTRGGRMYRTGDLARWRSDGQLEYLGRADQQVKVSGHRIEPAEIEHALEESPTLRRRLSCPVIGADGSLGLVAHVVAIDGRTVDVEATRAELTRTLPRAMLPAIVLHDQLPHTANGKVDRAALARHRQVDLTPSGRGEAPTGRGGELAEIELTIKDVWCRALERDDVGVHENFLDLGGTSLLAVHVRRELEERLARPVRMALVFQHPTIAALARHLCDLPGDCRTPNEETSAAPAWSGCASVGRPAPAEAVAGTASWENDRSPKPMWPSSDWLGGIRALGTRTSSGTWCAKVGRRSRPSSATCSSNVEYLTRCSDILTTFQ